VPGVPYTVSIYSKARFFTVAVNNVTYITVSEPSYYNTNGGECAYVRLLRRGMHALCCCTRSHSGFCSSLHAPPVSGCRHRLLPGTRQRGYL